jgi:hypothetical protein
MEIGSRPFELSDSDVWLLLAVAVVALLVVLPQLFAILFAAAKEKDE